MKLVFIIPFILIIHTSCISQEKKDEYWQKKLSKEQYYVLRQKGTERPCLLYTSPSPRDVP